MLTLLSPLKSLIQGDPDDRLIAASALKELRAIGERLFHLTGDEKTSDGIITIIKLIKKL